MQKYRFFLKKSENPGNILTLMHYFSCISFWWGSETINQIRRDCKAEIS